MSASVGATKPFFADERVEYLREYARVSLELRSEMEPEPGMLRFSAKANAMSAWLRQQALEVRRAIGEIGIDADANPLGEDLEGIALAIAEWQRAGDEAKRRSDALVRFRDECRELEQLEQVKQVIEQRGEGPAQRLAYGPKVPKHADVTAQVYARRDVLSQEQPDVERFLRDVGQSLGSWSLAGGVIGIVDFVADQVNRALGSYRRWPLSGPQREVKPMRDPKDCARLVFQRFKQAYDETLGQEGYFTLSHEHADAALTRTDWNRGAAFLGQKGILELEYEGHWKLTDDGKDVCAHPHTLDAELGPRVGAVQPPVQNNTFNVQQMQNTQLGHGSTMNVTYTTVLQQLLKEIEASEAPPEEKAAWSKKVNDVLSHPLTQTAITLAGGALLGSK